MAEPSLSNDIRTLRFLSSEMTQAELGRRIGVTRQTVAAIESGKYSPTLETAFRIAEVFNRPLEQVFQWKGQNKAMGTRQETRCPPESDDQFEAVE